MLVWMSHNGKDKSIFKCDRCDTKLSRDDRYRINVQRTSGKYKNINSWDFCKRCYISLVRGIEKGRRNKNGPSKQ